MFFSSTKKSNSTVLSLKQGHVQWRLSTFLLKRKEKNIRQTINQNIQL